MTMDLFLFLMVKIYRDGRHWLVIQLVDLR